ncbi:MAG: TonB-dependent receptor, partial [Planctomycetales bacterium]|nr:TonB-dependent receptor [Planctomycetales bacterium]
AVNFLVGNVKADYLQKNVFAGVQARTGLRDARIVTMPEFEVGAGWQSCGGCCRLTVGYYIAAWQNLMTTSEYLSIVRVTQNTFERPQETLTFDGLTARAEFRF